MFRIISLCFTLCFMTMVNATFSYAFAESQDQNPSSTMATVGRDGNIIALVVALNTNEVKAGELAAKRSKDSKVLAFANTMVNDHSNNREEALKLSSQNNIPAQSDRESKQLEKSGAAELKMLEATTPSSFDRKYIKAMINGHQKALSLIQKSISHASNAELKSFLEKTKNTVAHHLAMAKALKD